MALSASLQMKQGQSLVMTPQLQQAIKLLQLSNIELSSFVEQEMEKNPLLELADATSSGNESALPDSQNEAPDSGLTAADTQLKENSHHSDLDTDFENIVPDATIGSSSYSSDLGWTGTSSQGSSSGGSGEAPNIEAYLSAELSLRDHLEKQLHMSVSGPAEKMIAANLIDMVDEAGYLHGSLESLASRLGIDITTIRNTLATLQGFEPCGVFARTVSECLALQLKEEGALTAPLCALLDNLDLLAAHKFGRLKKLCNIDDTGLMELVATIKALNPKPGLKYGSVAVQPVTADVLVKARLDGSWHIELNSENLPKVLIDRSYFSVVNTSQKKSKDKTFLNQCLQTANWLVKSLDQRAQTILKVSEEIIRHQDAFFMHGVEHLRPLNLKTIADAINMHESTVSRATSGKYMGTSRGLFELKYFFSSSITASGSQDAHSSKSVKFKIRKLTDNETVDKVLSDDKLMALLRQDGIDIARRTVAKYREALHIPSSVQRRREKKLALQQAMA